jgi:GTP cyclohydrolase I
MPPAPPSSARSLPDVAAHHPPAAGGRIDRVGMRHIALPVRVRDAEGRLGTVPAEADVFVSLDRADAKGIHMSRLFLALQELLAKEELRPATLRDLLSAVLVSHRGLSESAHVEVRFDLLLPRVALESGHRGWHRYPIEVGGSLDAGGYRTELGFRVTYSSTCPCSAALSRELIRARFLEEFAGRALDAAAVAAWLASEAGMCATPHSQRSHADVRLAAAGAVEDLPIAEWIDRCEAALGTPVQSAVKREDEQAFAALNGKNLMFCEDAARRLRAALEGDARVRDYRIAVRHEESLHAHDAVSVLVKWVPGGLCA